jgi:hypothetical protein
MYTGRGQADQPAGALNQRPPPVTQGRHRLIY